MALVETPNLLTSNSYISEADADAFFAEQGTEEENTAWIAVSDKERPLIIATRQLDDSYDWIGRRTTVGNGQTTGQALEWGRRRVPRDGWTALQKLRPPFDIRRDINPNFTNNLPPVLFDRFDLIDLEGLDQLEDSVIPKEIEQATALLALAFTIKDRAADSTLDEIKSASLDGVGSVLFRDNLPTSQGTIPSKVHDIVRKYGMLKPSLNSETKTTTMRRVERG